MTVCFADRDAIRGMFGHLPMDVGENVNWAGNILIFSHTLSIVYHSTITLMKKKTPIVILLFTLIAMLFPACVTTELDEEKQAQMSHDGLVQKEAKYADAVFVRPGADLSGYSKVMLEAPEIAFRKNWQRDYNMDNPMKRLDDRSIEKMITEERKLFLEEFTKGLEKRGVTVVDEPGEDVLLLKPSLIDLYVVAPDPDNRAGMWDKVYAESFGDMTLFLEIYDSVTHQILVRSLDEKRDIGEGGGSWRFQRNRATNRADAGMAFSEWASMFVKGFNRAKESAQ